MTGDEKIEITSSAVKYFKGNGGAKREITFADIKEIHGFSNMSAYDEKGERFGTHMIKLTPKKGRSIVVCSCTFIKHGTGYRQVAKNHADRYIKVLIEIKKRVADANPDAVLVDGNLAASIGGYVCAMMGIGLLVMIVVGTLFSRKPVSDNWHILLIVVLFGLIFIPWGLGLGKSYWPKRVSLAETINPANESAGDA